MIPIEAKTPRNSGSIADWLVIGEPLKLGPKDIIDRIHHVDLLAAPIGKDHRLDVFLERPQRVDARLFCQRDRRLRVGPILAFFHDGAEEQEDVVGWRFEREIAFRHLAVIVRRQQEIEPAAGAVGADRADIRNDRLRRTGAIRSWFPEPT
jgi:hypothetical protein